MLWILNGFFGRIKHDIGEIFRKNSKNLRGLGQDYPQPDFTPNAAPFGGACPVVERQPAAKPTGPFQALEAPIIAPGRMTEEAIQTEEDKKGVSNNAKRCLE